MNIKDFSSNELTVRSIDTLNELKEALKENEPSMIIGDLEEGLNSFYLLKFKDCKTSIGLCSHSHGQYAGCKRLNDGVIIYNNQTISLLSQNMSIDWQREVDGIIYEIVLVANKIVVVHEIGVKCFSEKGEVLWNHCTDIINNHHVVGDTLTISTDEGSTVLSLISGEIL